MIEPKNVRNYETSLPGSHRPGGTMSSKKLSVDAELEKIQRETFGYFLHETNPANGLVIDKTAANWPASIAATGPAQHRLFMNAANSISCLPAETCRVESITGYALPKPIGPRGTFVSATSAACRQTIWPATRACPRRLGSMAYPFLRFSCTGYRGELGAIQAARMYAETLLTVGDFDLVLLGLGEDGHTASLFPDHEWGTAPGSPDTLAVFEAPRPPPQRVSLSATRLSRARQVIFLVSGESKHRAVAEWRAGKDIPVRAIMPAAGVDVLVEFSLLVPLAVPC